MIVFPIRRAVLVSAMLALSVVAHAQTPASGTSSMTLQEPQNVLQLSTSASVDVRQDLLTLSLATAREGTDAAAVQAQLRSALDAALKEVGKTAQPGAMDVRTGDFSVHPRYGRDSKITGWQGRAELLLEGRDFARITEAAARAPGMPIGHVSFALSREQRERAEAQAQAQAIASFKGKAAEIAKAFGFAGYALREVSVGSSDSGFAPRMYGMAKEMRAVAADAPVPVEPGKSTVQVTVSGSVQAR